MSNAQLWQTGYDCGNNCAIDSTKAALKRPKRRCHCVLVSIKD